MWVDWTAKPGHPCSAAQFFSAANGAVLSLSFSLGLDRGHAHIQLAHHQKTAVGTELRATKFQPHPAVKTKPPITPFECTLWVIHNPLPSA